MTDGFQLIKIDGDITKPVTVFIEKISDAIGGLSRPSQIRRVAKAEADAEIIREQTNIEISEIQRRAFNRFVTEEAKKQDNIESITEKAIPELDETANPQDMNDDWIMNFFDKCRIVSDSEMQFLWSKVLAGEANNPGSYSKRTVNLLGSFDKSDALLFSSLCGFIFMIRQPYPLIFDTDALMYNEKYITFGGLTHLDDIGLITFNHITGYTLRNFSQEVQISYFGTILTLRFNKPENNELKIGKILPTQSGIELSQVCNPKPVDGFFDYCIEQFTKQGITCIK